MDPVKGMKIADIFFNKQLITTAKYIFFEGLSKGGEQLILISIPLIFKDYNQEYLSILLLISLTGLIRLVNPVNNANAIFKLVDKFQKQEILNTVFFLNLIVFLFCLSLCGVFYEGFLEYYNITSFWPILLLAGYMFFRNFFEISSFYEVLIENHNRSMFIKNMPFLLSFVLQLIFLFVIKMDIIFGFFLAKFLAFSLLGAWLVFRGEFRPRLTFNQNVFKEVLRYGSTLWMNVFVGWLMGYGALNLTKLFLDDNYSLVLGRTINLWMVLILLANGFNNVYIPILKRKYAKSFHSSIVFRNKALFLYLGIALLGLLMSLPLSKIWPLEDLKLVPFVFFILFAQGFQYVSSPFYFMSDNFKRYVYINTISAVFMLSYYLILFKNSDGLSMNVFLGIYLLSYLFRSLLIFNYSVKGAIPAE